MPKQINALTSTRGFAALLVVLLHRGYYLFPFRYFRFFESGNVAVSYFFVLSGFVLTLNYKNKVIKFKDYFKRRFARIAPVYYLAMILFIMPGIYIMYVNHHFFDATFRHSFFLSVFFLQGWTKYSMTINAPAWSLSVEMLFYVLFPLFLYLAKKNIGKFISYVALFWLISQAINLWLWYKYLHVVAAETVLICYPLFHINEFLVGMIGVFLFTEYTKIHFRYSSLVLLIAFVIMSTLCYTVVNIYSGLFAPLFLLLILSLTKKEPRFLQHKYLVYFGEISYGIYILQYPIAYYLYKQINVKFLHLPQPYIFYLYLIVLIVCSAFSYNYIESPLRRKINSLGTKKTVQSQPDEIVLDK